jgi:hypothetical protein
MIDRETAASFCAVWLRCNFGANMIDSLSGRMHHHANSYVSARRRAIHPKWGECRLSATNYKIGLNSGAF